ncbi:uncharacterized protein LAJ45_00484 [Morchella importuna]|uniref:Osmotin, thaumatin-like protein n=1 Tax=Morchella conica CCBAS932 TaxID=1392247 RepID=A0A3N4KIV3_9PEZI|nr:uncharacterized protein LAJ45_00484 [Morchella importuna]KAH8155474.1 hypothetical protein LAJ45_00484 [Morchella importuna]RPB10494.1 hypothetical protein P167DRAFT_559591 [Morchella conica CCBAS932]
MRSTTSRSLALQLLLLVPSLHFAAATPAYDWPAGIDPSEKYWPPGTGPPSKRSLQEEYAEFNSTDRCSAVRKVSAENPAEKYYWDWDHEARSQQGFLGISSLEVPEEEEPELEPELEDGEDLETRSVKYRAPLRMRSFASDDGIIGVLLGKRQNFECPTGTYSCTDIGVPGSCCRTSEICERITDTGMGVVGCCPSGQQCGGSLTSCGDDMKTCASNQGGGCCISGYSCSVNGCIADSAAGVASTCSSGFYACPSNVAGGCCPSGRLCGVTDCPTQTATATASGDICPTGYYTCAPQYNGGCCRIGRDCGITECPERALTISAGGAGGGAGGVLTMTTPASCASGWQSCASSLGGGCCPNGYNCGMTNCPAVTLGSTAFIISGSTVTTALVMPATAKAQPTDGASIVIPNDGNRVQDVKKVFVVVGVVLGVAAAA